MTFRELQEAVQRAGFVSVIRGTSCLYHTWKAGDDVPEAIECFRRNAGELLFHRHRRGLK